jgi:hypothetical protein
MTNAYALQPAKVLRAMIADDASHAEPIYAYLMGAEASRKHGLKNGLLRLAFHMHTGKAAPKDLGEDAMHASLAKPRVVAAPVPAPAPAAPVADVPKARNAAPKPDADAALRARVEASLTASREAFLAAFFAK